MTTKNKYFSFIDNLSFDNLSSLLNELGIMTHPMSNEQKVCIEYPNIHLENKLFNIFETKKDSNDLIYYDKEHPSNKTVTKLLNNEYELNLPKNKLYTIDPIKLYNEFNKNIPYSIEEFKNSLKIFVSIFNCFNEDLLNWNLEDFNLFNNDNKIQILNFNKDNNYDNKIEESLENLYKKHFSVYDYEETEIIEVLTNKISNESNQKTNNEDFEDDFEMSFNIKKSEKNVIKYNDNDNDNTNLYSYEKDKIFRNIYFIMNLFNLMNNFNLTEFNLDNILKNIDLLNFNIINDYKILLIICFHLSIQINLFINEANINTFLKIDDNTINKNNQNKNGNQTNNDNKIVNNYITNIFYIDSQKKENEDDLKIEKDNNELIKEKILFLNIILKLFNITYFYKNKIPIKINIKIFNLEFLSDIKNKIIFPENIFQYINNIDKIFNFIKNNEFVELFFPNNNSKNYFSILSFELILLKDININQLNEITKIYSNFITNCDFVSFDTKEIDSLIKYPLTNYSNELNILLWALKYILKIGKFHMKKFSFSFIFNSFSIAIKKDLEKKDYIIQDMMIFTGIYHYYENELLEFLIENENYHLIYRQYKEIIKCFSEYKNYNINIKLFKNGIYNKELLYIYITIIFNIFNNLNLKNNDFLKKIVLCENKLINASKYIFLHINSYDKKEEKQDNDLLSKSDNRNIQIKLENSDSISPRKKNKNYKNSKFLNIFNKKTVMDEDNNSNNINIFSTLMLDKKSDKQKKMNQKINNFLKRISSSQYLSSIEANTINNFIKEIKHYFSDILFYINKNDETSNNTNKYFFEKTSDNLVSFEPLTLLRNFNNNKCFFILKDYSNIDLYIYLYDLYDNKLDKNNKDINNKTKIEIFNNIINSINNLKQTCKKEFTDKKSSITISKINFIFHKYFLLLNQYFKDNKLFFNEENRLIILDKFSQTDCILDNNHLTIVLKNNLDINNKNLDKNEDYFVKFYSTFLYEYDVLKYIILDKKLLKFNKLDIIINRRILQINNGQIQLKKINLYDGVKPANNIIEDKDLKIEEEKEDIKKEEKEEKEEEKEIEIFVNEDENYDKNKENSKDIKKINLNKSYYSENYNLFNIKELFKYENSYPLIIFFLQNETEISNLSFLIFSFDEIFSSNSSKELTKEIIIKKLIKFFYRFRISKLTPIIFSKKYFLYFLNFFNKIILKKSNSKNMDESLKKQNENNANKYIFENIIFFPIYSEDISYDIKNDLTKEGIFINLTKNISIFKIQKEIPYNINQVGKMFKFHKILDTISELGKISTLNINDFNNNIIIYNIDVDSLNVLLKKNLKKVKFIGINKHNKTMNIHVYNSNDILVKCKNNKNCINNNNDCIIY